MTHLSRFLYRCLVQLHPPAFRRQFAPEMLWIFDEIADHDARIELFADALTSLGRQWVVRWAIQKLLIGEFRFAPLPAGEAGRFHWERIEFDDRPLPPPRVIQGGLVAFAFFTCIALAAFHANTVRRASISGSGSGFSGFPAAAGPQTSGGSDYDGREPLTNSAVALSGEQQSTTPPDDGRPPRIPDTPAGHRFFEWLDAFDSGDKTKLEQFLKEHYPARSDANAVGMEMQFRDQTGGFEFKDFDRDASSTTKFVGIVKERASDNFARFVIEVDPADERHITSLSLNIVPRPAKFVLPRMTERDALTAFRETLKDEAASDRFSGVALVAKNGTPIFTSAYGMADRDKKIQNTLDTKFRIGSMNKMFTATAVLQLAQAGKLKLSDPVGKYIPNYPNKNIATKVTVEQLLSHTGGTGDFFGPESTSIASNQNPRRLRQFLRRARTSVRARLTLGIQQLRLSLARPRRRKSLGRRLLRVRPRKHLQNPPAWPLPIPCPKINPFPIVPWVTQKSGAARRGSRTPSHASLSRHLRRRRLLHGPRPARVRHGRAGSQTARRATHRTPHHGSHQSQRKREIHPYGFMDKTEGGVRSFGHGGGTPGMNGELRIYPASAT